MARKESGSSKSDRDLLYIKTWFRASALTAAAVLTPVGKGAIEVGKDALLFGKDTFAVGQVVYDTGSGIVQAIQEGNSTYTGVGGTLTPPNSPETTKAPAPRVKFIVPTATPGATETSTPYPLATEAPKPTTPNVQSHDFYTKVCWTFNETPAERKKVSANPDFLITHDSSVSADVIQKTLYTWHSPTANLVMYDSCGHKKTFAQYVRDESDYYHIDAAMPMGIFYQESKYGTQGVAPEDESMGNARPKNDTQNLRKYPNWFAGADDTISLLYKYDNLWGWGPDMMHAAQHWAPWGDGNNNPVIYAENVEQEMTNYYDADLSAKSQDRYLASMAKDILRVEAIARQQQQAPLRKTK